MYLLRQYYIIFSYAFPLLFWLTEDLAIRGYLGPIHVG